MDVFDRSTINHQSSIRRDQFLSTSFSRGKEEKTDRGFRKSHEDRKIHIRTFESFQCSPPLKLGQWMIASGWFIVWGISLGCSGTNLDLGVLSKAEKVVRRKVDKLLAPDRDELALVSARPWSENGEERERRRRKEERELKEERKKERAPFDDGDRIEVELVQGIDGGVNERLGLPVVEDHLLFLLLCSRSFIRGPQDRQDGKEDERWA